MKCKLPFLLLIFVWAAGISQSPAQTATSVSTDTDALLSYQDAISVDYLKKHLSAIAADSMEGRKTGSRGQQMAAEYLAEEYRRLGLKPAGDNNSFQA